MTIDKQTTRQINATLIGLATSIAITLKKDSLIVENQPLSSLVVTLPFAWISASSKDFKKIRGITSLISGILISDQLLPSSSDPKINILKTASLVGLLYYSLTPEKIKPRKQDLPQPNPDIATRYYPETRTPQQQRAAYPGIPSPKNSREPISQQQTAANPIASANDRYEVGANRSNRNGLTSNRHPGRNSGAHERVGCNS